MKTALRLLVGLSLSGLFLWLAFRNVNGAEMWAQMKTIHPGYIAAYVASVTVIQLCRIFRWGELIKPFAPLAPGPLFRISSIGLMLILVLPLRLGEFGRPYLLKKETGARMSSGLGSIVVERAIDGLLVTLLFFVTTFWLGSGTEVPRELVVAAYMALGFFASVTAVVVAVLVARDHALSLLRRIGTPISQRLTEKAIGMMTAFVDGMRSLPDVRSISRFTAYTLIYWVANGFGMYLLMVGFGWDVPMLAGFVLVCVLVIGIMIPAGPGFLGTFQLSIVAGLAIFGIGETAAAAYSMVVYPIQVAVVVGFGLPFLLGRGGDVTAIMRASRDGETDNDAAAAP